MKINIPYDYFDNILPTIEEKITEIVAEQLPSYSIKKVENSEYPISLEIEKDSEKLFVLQYRIQYWGKQYFQPKGIPIVFENNCILDKTKYHLLSSVGDKIKKSLIELDLRLYCAMNSKVHESLPYEYSISIIEPIVQFDYSTGKCKLDQRTSRNDYVTQISELFGFSIPIGKNEMHLKALMDEFMYIETNFFNDQAIGHLLPKLFVRNIRDFKKKFEVKRSVKGEMALSYGELLYCPKGVDERTFEQFCKALMKYVSYCAKREGCKTVEWMFISFKHDREYRKASDYRMSLTERFVYNILAKIGYQITADCTGNWLYYCANGPVDLA